MSSPIAPSCAQPPASCPITRGKGLGASPSTFASVAGNLSTPARPRPARQPITGAVPGGQVAQGPAGTRPPGAAGSRRSPATPPASPPSGQHARTAVHGSVTLSGSPEPTGTARLVGSGATSRIDPNVLPRDPLQTAQGTLQATPPAAPPAAAPAAAPGGDGPSRSALPAGTAPLTSPGLVGPENQSSPRAPAGGSRAIQPANDLQLSQPAAAGSAAASQGAHSTAPPGPVQDSGHPGNQSPGLAQSPTRSQAQAAPAPATTTGTPRSAGGNAGPRSAVPAVANGPVVTTAQHARQARPVPAPQILNSSTGLAGRQAQQAPQILSSPGAGDWQPPAAQAQPGPHEPTGEPAQSEGIPQPVTVNQALTTSPDGSSRISLSVEEPGLGVVRASFVSRSAQMAVRIYASNDATHGAIEQALGRLHGELATLPGHAERTHVELMGREGQQGRHLTYRGPATSGRSRPEDGAANRTEGKPVRALVPTMNLVDLTL